jgi:hypothetical protein
VEEAAVGFAIVSLVGIDLPNGVFGMATGGDAMGKINAVTDRGRRQIRGKNKTMINVHGGMFL